MKSIQTKILAVVIAGLLVITAVVSIIAVNMTHEIMHKDADRILKNAAEKEAAFINDVLGDVMKSSNVMTHYATTNISNGDLQNSQFDWDAYLLSAENMFSEVTVNTSGVEGYFLRIDPKYKDGTTGFYKMINENGEHISMPVTDINKYDKNDKQNVGWYYAAVNAGQGVWLEPYFYPGTDIQLISYVQPLYVDGTFYGVLGFDMNFSYLIQKIDNIGVYEQGYAKLTSTDEKTIYNKVVSNTSENPQTEAKVQLKNGMFLVIHAAYKDIQKDIHPMLSKIVFAFVAVLVCSIIYTVLVTKKIVAPLKRLTAAAEALSNDGVNSIGIDEITIDTNDEIGTLSKTLNTTYSKILEYTSYINALAYRDSLTGIKNSTAYTEIIAEINKEILTSNCKFGVLVADINNLKETNDKYGHDVGNELIIHTSKILTSTFANSAIYRIGGDEFAVILQGKDYENYHSLIEKMDEACSSDYITVCEKNIPISVARGVSIYDSSIDHVYEDVFSKADHAMYMNKESMKFSLTH